MRLGVALGERVDDVMRRTVARVGRTGKGSRADLDPAVNESFERIGRNSTHAVSEWMAGVKPERAQESGERPWDTYGRLAAHGGAPLNEVTKRCLRWRDAVIEVLGERAAELGISQAALMQALALTQRILDVTLVRMCEAFEQERARMAKELTRRDEELVFMATHDQLTGLPNRTLILDRGKQMLGRARRRSAPVAALFIDLDNFTSINDTLGHAAGDELLQAIAARLDGVVRDIDALGRIGGDEFVVLAEEFCDGVDAELIAERLREALRAPFALAAGEHAGLTVTASIGVAAGERTTVEDLLRDAHIAVHRAKRDGKDRHVVFESDMHDVVQSRMQLEMDLRAALAQDEFFLLYQPTFDLRGMVPTGVEALLRWRSAVRGVVQPVDFIPLLEETGLIVEVGRWVLAEVCRQGACWRAAGHPIGVAVNVSARRLETDQFVADVREALESSGLQACALTLEITETTLMRNPEQTARRLHAIKDLGVRIAIDDFGTGYSSFAHLQRFPVDSLKIDRSFISQLSENPEGETLLRTLVQLGKALTIETLAEGIEQEHELTLLQEECCDSGQGYLFARPLDVQAAAAFLENWRGGEPETPARGAAQGSVPPVGALARFQP
ncbi:MAG TPA: EAL domain-containing protein [Solirubrobacteraceae bacterium]|jgi:diguanylate cyclase (GGDEF)-like protein|nr:EAL domain-containing protein [Solirubrobacteraceae bacterium]